MNNAPRSLCIAVLVSLIAAAAAAAPPPSHVNQPVVEHVVLEGVVSPDGGACTWLYRGLGHGSQVPAVLVPAGRRLVITDVEWQVYGNQGAFSPADSLWVEIRLTDDGPVGTYRVFLSRTLPGLGQSLVGASEQLTTGFTVAPKTSMCALPYGVHGETDPLLTVYNVLLRGYLIGAGTATPGPTS
jgi:hypothetical protein